LSLKCVLRRNQSDNPNFAASSPSLFECAQFAGWVERLVRRSSTSADGSDSHQLLLGTVMGFASLYPSCEVCDFCPRASSRTLAALSRTVAALRQSRPFRPGPVVLRFANRPRPPVLSAQFAFTGVAGIRPALKARLRKSAFLPGNSPKGRPKKRRTPMLA
jgi:hypothetical protein